MTYGTIELSGSDDELTTKRMWLEYLSKDQSRSIAAIREEFPPERLERIRRRYPYCSKLPRNARTKMGLLCDLRRSTFRCSVIETTVRIEFSDGTVTALDLKAVPEEQLQHLAMFS